jgi:hypothetical protein
MLFRDDMEPLIDQSGTGARGIYSFLLFDEDGVEGIAQSTNHNVILFYSDGIAISRLFRFKLATNQGFEVLPNQPINVMNLSP